jgi:hypothetical protein
MEYGMGVSLSQKSSVGDHVDPVPGDQVIDCFFKCPDMLEWSEFLQEIDGGSPLCDLPELGTVSLLEGNEFDR